MKRALTLFAVAMLLPLFGCANAKKVEMTGSPSSSIADVSQLETPEYDLCTLVCFARPMSTAGVASIVSSPRGRDLGMSYDGSWIAKVGSASLKSGKIAATLETDFLAVAYSNENKEFRFVVNDTVYAGKGSIDLAGYRLQTNSQQFEITGLALYKGLLSLESLEEISGIKIKKGRSSYPISVRYNPKAPRLMANWLSPGDLMTVSMKDLAIYDPVTKDRILSLNKGAKLYLGNPGAEAGYERVTTEGGIKGVATSLSLIYGTKSKKRPFFDLGFSANDSLVHSGQLFGVPEWLVMLLWLASVPALHFLSVRLLGSPRKRLAITNLGPALLVALGYMAANVISLLKRQSSSIKPEIEWFYSSLHLTPARFSSYVHWALYLAWIFAIIAFAVLVSEHVKLGGKKALLSIPCALAANLLAYDFFEILALLFSYIISAIIFFAFLSLLSRFFGRRRVYVHHHFLHKH